MSTLVAIKILGNLKFLTHNLKLPAASGTDGAKGWAEKFFRDRDRESDEMTGVPQTIPPWFIPQKPGYKYHQKTCDEIGKGFKDFHDAMIDAVDFAHKMWKLQARFQDLKILGPVALGTPGCLKGPELESLIKTAPQVAAYTGNLAKHRDAVAKGVSQCFKDWQDNVMIPGLPLYPMFAAFPGPYAPPMPNVPVPLIACPSAMMAKITVPQQMATAMGDALDSGLKQKDPEKHYEALHDAIATVLALAFLIWLPTQMVSLVLGKGPIPTFAPPVVPVGPVMNGDNLPIPGHLMA